MVFKLTQYLKSCKHFNMKIHLSTNANLGKATRKFISLNCGETLGVFQGQIVHVDPCSQKITLEKAFQNGFPYHSRQVTISAKDIKSLEMIEAYSDPSPSTAVNIKKPVAKKAVHSLSDKQFFSKDNTEKETPKKNIDDGNKSNNCNDTVRTPNKKERQRQRWISRDEAAFGSPIDCHMTTDFDFEKNLALFNKKAFYEEINASKPDVVKHTDKKGGRYRCDENILNSKPPVYRQIKLMPQPGSIEYVTDSGLIVPSLSTDLRKRVLAIAERFGLSFEKQSEIIGRACTEMALLLLGGAHRLNPQNQHQCPNVTVLCGSHRTGAQGVNCARQLASHGVKTTVYIQDPVELTTEMTHELALYRMTSCKVTTVLQDLNTAPVDLIILALLDSKSTVKDVITPAARWANDNRAHVLSIDPPQGGTLGVTAKYSLVPALPLSYDSCNGKIYLCNIGIPLQVFKDAGIAEYVSPFGPKFFMPLYPNDI